ncbi:MAG: hypothetical protein AUG50_02310 [Betaproteobacteria bacterium 13_1_20CM_3_63_8]|nr:MAG: hypothetical protein AUG50_02310 [Betaproteobacteria bacterium 13_1_20CM_3_63_8]
MREAPPARRIAAKGIKQIADTYLRTATILFLLICHLNRRRNDLILICRFNPQVGPHMPCRSLRSREPAATVVNNRLASDEFGPRYRESAIDQK